MPVSAPLRLDCDADSLVANWRFLKTAGGGAACGAAVKADAYGLGAVKVARRLAAAGCRDLFVATWAEAEALGPLPDGVALSVLHGIRAEDMATALGSPARPVLNSAEQVARWRGAGGGACDVMVDTGMNRLGLSAAEAASGLLEGLAIETLMSHLACADEPGHALNTRQQAAFAALRGQVSARRYSLANSAGILLGRDYAFDLTRPGLALYGGVPVPGDARQRAGLRPVAAISAAILQVRTVAAGETVGYGATWAAPRDSRIAIVNAGYADGLLNRLAAGLAAHHDGRRLPVVGRISMDMMAIDLGPAPLREGDWLRLDLDLPDLAAMAGLSQYELLTRLGDRF
ncbi:alanine racemase, partial [Sphingomonas sp.]|uniref:alanine racemase n=1 Tax=Sphingomonas sp. TaxID=28214 RepID=UPI003B3ABFBD